jgi:uncharacterized protein (DUF1330 family)
MPAYVVARLDVTDPETMGQYVAAVTPVIESFGGRYLFAGPGTEALEGDRAPGALAIIEFPSHADARRWYESSEYAPLIELRQRAANSSLVLTPDTGAPS